jgi:hypothetical protein
MAPTIPSPSISLGVVLGPQRLARADAFWTLPSTLSSPGALI